MAARTTNEISSETPVTHRMKISVIAEQEMYNKNQFFYTNTVQNQERALTHFKRWLQRMTR